MTGYIINLPYNEAMKVVKLIRKFAQEKSTDEQLSPDVQTSWKTVDASYGVGEVTVMVDIDERIHELNVMLADANCGLIGFDKPFAYKTPTEKKKAIRNAEQ